MEQQAEIAVVELTVEETALVGGGMMAESPPENIINPYIEGGH